MSKCLCCCGCTCVTIILMISIGFGLLYWLFPYPSHASCQVVWQAKVDCPNAQMEIVDLIKRWSDTECTEKRRCRYELTGSEKNIVNGIRTTQDFHFVDSFMFNFTSASYGCEIFGESSSNAAYAILDFGFNYCNIKNLILGAGFNTTEFSSDSVCTMYSLAYCKNYVD